MAKSLFQKNTSEDSQPTPYELIEPEIVHLKKGYSIRHGAKGRPKRPLWMVVLLSLALLGSTSWIRSSRLVQGRSDADLPLSSQLWCRPASRRVGCEPDFHLRMRSTPSTARTGLSRIITRRPTQPISRPRSSSNICRMSVCSTPATTSRSIPSAGCAISSLSIPASSCRRNGTFSIPRLAIDPCSTSQIAVCAGHALGRLPRYDTFMSGHAYRPACNVESKS